MQNCQTLIHAGILITQNKGRDVREDAGIALKDGIVQQTGDWLVMRQEWQAEEELDLGDCLVMPGLINSHTHGAMTFLRGLADDQPLMSWLNDTVFPVEARLTPEITRLGALLGHAEMLATGTTACVDMYIHEASVLDAAATSGIRCLGGEAIFQFPSAACASWQDAIGETRRLAEKYAGHERIRVAVNPHSVYTTTPEILAACSELAVELALPLHTHLAETQTETRTSLEQHGRRPVDHCLACGLMQARLIAAHLVDIEPEEARLLAAHAVSGCHNPSSNMKLASGAAPVTELLEAGVKVGIGTDGPASNNQLNMFAEMGRAALLQKLVRGDPGVLPAQTVLDMATLGGAAVFGDPALGSIKPGSSADLIALELSRPNLQPVHNPVAQVVYAASGHEVVMTMIAGEVVYRNGRFTRFDYPALLKEVQGFRDFVRARK